MADEEAATDSSDDNKVFSFDEPIPDAGPSIFDDGVVTELPEPSEDAMPSMPAEDDMAMPPMPDMDMEMEASADASADTELPPFRLYPPMR